MEFKSNRKKKIEIPKWTIQAMRSYIKDYQDILLSPETTKATVMAYKKLAKDGHLIFISILSELDREIETRA